MTVNKVGRPSKARERIAEILRATATVVARDGLANTTLSQVAAAAGMQRTLVLHYFGSRDSLIQAFVDEAVAAYGTAMLRVDNDEKLLRRIHTMFAPGAYHSREDLVVWSELVALGARDPHVRQRLHALWARRWLPELEQQLADQYPSASPDEISSAAYGLACLFEAHWAFHLQGITGPDRQRQAQHSAQAILDSLTTTAP
ncbi:HTH-type transcriptional regulator BetI [Mycolicibacterium vanbaalenii]|uniref:HTH-type transcriptional regulator BetI n=1 Tax=Mycolicibacterium vanbaalenii TaxID=110539 RepID=A0A5S9N3L7_MYCVN|nr:TetR/AcrR family transcriptional regulator [Mycolicibacterium vanbaalenii]CAA0082505.1 HTH-type transcriptional regulator BetI [Mycolicibacterium vanbaalenii]